MVTWVPHFGGICIIVVLLLPQSLASDSVEGSCAEDVTSLLQVKDVVKSGKRQGPDTKEADVPEGAPAGMSVGEHTAQSEGLPMSEGPPSAEGPPMSGGSPSSEGRPMSDGAPMAEGAPSAGGAPSAEGPPSAGENPLLKKAEAASPAEGAPMAKTEDTPEAKAETEAAERNRFISQTTPMPEPAAGGSPSHEQINKVEVEASVQPMPEPAAEGSGLGHLPMGKPSMEMEHHDGPHMDSPHMDSPHMDTVHEAYHSSMEHVSKELRHLAASDMAGVHHYPKMDDYHQGMLDRMKAAKDATLNAVEEDKARVEQAFMKRKQEQDEAVQQARDQRESAKQAAVEEYKAQQAAALGRIVGRAHAKSAIRDVANRKSFEAMRGVQAEAQMVKAMARTQLDEKHEAEKSAHANNKREEANAYVRHKEEQMDAVKKQSAERADLVAQAIHGAHHEAVGMWAPFRLPH